MAQLKVKKLIHMTSAQAKWIEKTAKKLEISQSELLRRLIDEEREREKEGSK